MHPKISDSFLMTFKDLSPPPQKKGTTLTQTHRLPKKKVGCCGVLLCFCAPEPGDQAPEPDLENQDCSSMQLFKEATTFVLQC